MELDDVIRERLMKDESIILRNYSTNVADAFSVLEKLHSQGWFWRLDSVHDGVICTIQGVPKDAKSLKDRITYTIRAATAAQAICECALKTLG